VAEFRFHRLRPQVAHFSSSVDTFAAPTVGDRKNKHKQKEKEKQNRAHTVR